jgi:hypothetical protein
VFGTGCDVLTQRKSAMRHSDAAFERECVQMEP